MDKNKILRTLHRDRKYVVNFCSKYNRIYLYGAGKTAELFYSYLNEEEIPLYGVIVSDGQEKHDFHNLPIFNFSECQIQEDDGIILAMNSANRKTIIPKLVEKGLKKNCFMRGSVFSEQDGFEDASCLLDWHNIKCGSFFESYTLLDNIGEKYGTDKCSEYHDYLRKYEFFISKWKNQSFVLLDLGVYKGASLKTLGEYFLRAEIIGVDIDRECKSYEGENRKVVITDLALWDNITKLAQYNPSIVIDDASHTWGHQIKALFALFPTLPSGGVYIVEDLGTSFHCCDDLPYSDASISAYDLLSAVAEVVTSREFLRNNLYSREIGDISDQIQELASHIDMISFVHGSCVLIKR
jgi:hypothetical protein